MPLVTVRPSIPKHVCIVVDSSPLADTTPLTFNRRPSFFPGSQLDVPRAIVDERSEGNNSREGVDSAQIPLQTALHEGFPRDTDRAANSVESETQIEGLRW